ncbi:MAG: CPBP family intramembrane metalloprotease [Saprospiraceae bacterium]|nr:CPBP family intramembrane metalloprotease [Saprospiraceae bacterium]
MLKSTLYKLFVKTFYDAQSESAAFNQIENSNKFDFKVLYIVIISAFSLLFIEYLGKFPGYRLSVDFLDAIGLPALGEKLKVLIESNPNSRLFKLGYWVSIVFLFYFIIPALSIKLVFKENLRDYGLRIGEFYKDYKIYVLLLIIMIPLVLWLSTTKGFQLKYPFYRLLYGENLWPNFWIWQLLYLIQFIALEFFFRGFMVHGLKKRFGFYSVLFMMIPYCMIHFGKPLPETIAAIFAGFILGTLSLKGKSVFLGILIHYSVAILMDLAALWQRGLL